MLSSSRDAWGWSGRARITVRRHASYCPHVRSSSWACACEARIVEQVELENTITTIGKNMARDMLLGLVGDAKVRWFGVGTDATAPAVGQTQLIAEVFRKITTTSTQGAAGESINTVFIAPNEAVAAINELGFFCGPAAGSGANTGIMVARVLYAHSKTALESIQVDRHDQF